MRFTSVVTAIFALGLLGLPSAFADDKDKDKDKKKDKDKDKDKMAEYLKKQAEAEQKWKMQQWQQQELQRQQRESAGHKAQQGVPPQRPVAPPMPVDGVVVRRQRPVVVAVDEVAPANLPAGVAEFLRVHNAARAEVGVAPLQWSERLARNAQQWADQLSVKGRMMHNPATSFGENLAAQSGGLSPAEAAKLWLAEKADFKRGQIGPGRAGHYTQMVWRDTTHVGFGIAVVKGMTVVVANYEPAGNYTNQPAY